MDKEVNAGLLKHLPDRVLPLTAQSTMQVSMPPLISYIQRQFHHLGESSSQLTRWVIGRDGLASTVLRAIRPPLLSRTFDYIWRKANFVPLVWQQTLDLPWYHGDRKWRRHSTHTTGTITDSNPDASLQRDEIYPDIFQQFSSDIEEGQPGYRADETYPPAITSTYPSINTNLLSPPLLKDGLPITGNISPTASPITLPVNINKIPEKDYTIGLAQSLPVTAKELSVRRMDEAYPAIIKNLFSKPVFMQKATGTTDEPDNPAQASSSTVSTEQIRNGKETRSGTQLISPQAEHSDIPSDANQSHEIREPDHKQTSDTEDTIARDDQQTQYTGLGQKLSRLLTPITPQKTPQHESTEAYPEADVESTGEDYTSPTRYAYDTKSIETEEEANGPPDRQAAFPLIANIPKITALRKPILSTIHKMPALASLKLEAMLKRISPLHTSPALSELTVPEATLKQPGSFISRLLHPSTPRLDRDWNQRTSVSPSVEQEDRKADVLYETQSMADMSQILNRLHPLIPEYGSNDQDSVEGQANGLISDGESPSTDIPPVQPLAVPENIHDTMTLQSQQLFKSGTPAPLSDIGKKYRFLPGREYIPSAPDSNYTYQLAPEMPLTVPIQAKAERGVADSEELFTDISENIYELPYYRSQRAPELSLAPVIGYTPVMTSSQIARAELPESGGAEIDEDVTKPDIDVIAEDVYRILKRRLSIERERKLGVF
jgi:hypothetical protein